MGRVRVWIEDAQCVSCGGIYKINPRYPMARRCKQCTKSYNKRIKRIDRVLIISFLIFPLGLLMYFLWKDKKPHYAKPAIKSASISMGIFFVFMFILHILNTALLG